MYNQGAARPRAQGPRLRGSEGRDDDDDGCPRPRGAMAQGPRGMR
jgi:hypothetical protein